MHNIFIYLYIIYVKVGKDFVKLIALLRRLDSSALEQVQSSLEGTCDSRRNAFRFDFSFTSFP